MKCVKSELSEKLASIELHVFADWHIGDPHCNMSDISKQIKYIQETDNAFVICNGDLIDNATKTSLGDVYTSLSPMKQCETLVELLSPIKNKILAMTSGNHELRTYRKEGINISQLVAAELGLSDRFATEGLVLFLRFGRISRGYKDHHGKVRKQGYSIYITHGTGGGRKEGAKAIRLADMQSIVDADVFIHSHTHLPMIMKESYHRISNSNCKCEIVEKLFVNTSSKLEYGGYGQQYEYKPSSISTPVILLSGARREMTARL